MVIDLHVGALVAAPVMPPTTSAMNRHLPRADVEQTGGSACSDPLQQHCCQQSYFPCLLRIGDPSPTIADMALIERSASAGGSVLRW